MQARAATTPSAAIVVLGATAAIASPPSYTPPPPGLPCSPSPSLFSPFILVVHTPLASGRCSLSRKLQGSAAILHSVGRDDELLQAEPGAAGRAARAAGSPTICKF
jgi:hypothetical protein